MSNWSQPQRWRLETGLVLALLLAGCGSAPPRAPVESVKAPGVAGAQVAGADTLSTIRPLQQINSRWIPARWSDLPGFEDDALHEAWNAWLKSCERPGPVFAPLCPQVRLLSLGSAQEQRAWMQASLQPYRVDTMFSGAQGLLTAYYEPVMEASRREREGFRVAVYGLPPQWTKLLRSGKAWYTRQEIDTLPAARAALGGSQLLWLSDPVDVLTLQIQGSGRVHVRETDDRYSWVRLAYAGSNNQPYQSPGRWLLEQGAVQDASWSGIKSWMAQNPLRVQELLWSNPRVVFFREEALSELDTAFGPKGAQGVALTPGRSIAVDPQSIPYGTPVWLSSAGPAGKLQKLVLAQDTGSAIVGPLRADYFAGWGAQAGELAGRMKQGLLLWVLWPRAASSP